MPKSVHPLFAQHSTTTLEVVPIAQEKPLTQLP